VLKLSQLREVAKVFGNVLGSDVVVERLTCDFPFDNFDGLIAVDKQHLVVRASPDAILLLVFNEAYELVEPDFFEMFLTTFPCFMSEVSLIDALKVRSFSPFLFVVTIVLCRSGI
jgi:hypothetical protein